MKSLLLRAALLALCLDLAKPALGQDLQSKAAVPPKLAQLTAEQWREDLRFMVGEMKSRHPNLFHSVTKERFEAAVADLDARIPNLERNEIVVGFMRLAAMI